MNPGETLQKDSSNWLFSLAFIGIFTLDSIPNPG